MFLCYCNYSDKLANVQIVINCQYSVAQMCTWEDIHACLFRSTVLDDVMGQSELTTIYYANTNFSYFNKF